MVATTAHRAARPLRVPRGITDNPLNACPRRHTRRPRDCGCTIRATAATTPEVFVAAPDGPRLRAAPHPEDRTSPAADDAPTSVTAALNAAGSSRDGLDQVFGLVYVELKRIAMRVLSQSGQSTLNPTALVHEVYAKLIGSDDLG